MGKSDLSRNRFFQQPKGFDVLLAVFKYYLDLHHKVKFTNLKGICLILSMWCCKKKDMIPHLLMDFFFRKKT